jgi:hypothetical protein
LPDASRIKASDLLLVDANDAQTIYRPDAPDITAWSLHSEIHKRQWAEDYTGFASQHLAELKAILDEEGASYAR